MIKFFLIFLLASTLAKAQVVRSVYFYGDKIAKDKSIADSYAIYGYLNTENAWLYKRYDLSNNLTVTGAYADDALSIPQGKFVFYSDVYLFNSNNATSFSARKGLERFVAQHGFFKDGKEEGKWVLFFPDGNVQNYQTYKNGVLDGEYKTFNKFGEVVIDGYYKNGKMDGEWVFVKDRNIKVYKDGVLQSTNKWINPKKNR